MKSLQNKQDSALFFWCVAASLAAHLLFVFWAARRNGLGAPPPSSLEVDLTSGLATLPFAGEGPAKLAAPKRLLPSKPGPSLPSEKPLPAAPPKPTQLPQQWVLPGPQTKTLVEQPKNPVEAITPGGAKGGTGTSPLKNGSGEGANYGTPNGHGLGGGNLLALPKLLNRDEVLANLRKYYPEAERRAGKEGSVLVAVHIGVSGTVTGVDILEPAGADFNAAAAQVARLMLFSPAIGLDGKPVAVKISQPMVFRLSD